MNFDLYKKMLRGESSPEETEQVMQWLQEKPEALDAALLQEISALQEEGKIPAATRQQMLSFFASKGITAPAEAPVVTMVAGKKKWKQWASAAAVFLLVAAGWLTYTALQPKAHSLAWLQIQNTGTMLRMVTLPDSSQVWLQPQATLRYREDFTEHTERQVQLNGEGYFNVAQQASHPFIVQTGPLRTRVLGTTFNIEAYPTEQFIKVTLQKGKVQVTSTNATDSSQEQKVLAPGEMALYSRLNASLSVRASTVKNEDAWTSGCLVLNDVSLSDALRRIAVKYGRELRFDSLRARPHQHINAYYQRMSIDQVLTQLGFTCRFSAQKTATGGYTIHWD